MSKVLDRYNSWTAATLAAQAFALLCGMLALAVDGNFAALAAVMALLVVFVAYRGLAAANTLVCSEDIWALRRLLRNQLLIQAPLTAAILGAAGREGAAIGAGLGMALVGFVITEILRRTSR